MTKRTKTKRTKAKRTKTEATWRTLAEQVETMLDTGLEALDAHVRNIALSEMTADQAEAVADLLVLVAQIHTWTVKATNRPANDNSAKN